MLVQRTMAAAIVMAAFIGSLEPLNAFRGRINEAMMFFYERGFMTWRIFTG